MKEPFNNLLLCFVLAWAAGRAQKASRPDPACANPVPRRRENGCCGVRQFT